ncbi:MAG: MBL fold metallo-hydrolase, partial [Deltaproteobacteria bacterium]|nr:MBL fold metallo-hydrolase [Deltaproteobacteria bacterium]
IQLSCTALGRANCHDTNYGRTNCTGTTILLDLGMPLSNKRSMELHRSTESKIPCRPDAVLISHPHQDHFGLIDIIDPEVPVYIGELAKSLIDSTRMLLSEKLHTNNFQYFKSNQQFQVGEFTITPYLVDHSAVDAYGFLIEVQGIRVFYSGDFRSHGRKSILFDKLIKDPPKNIDLLFMEGTMIERQNDDSSTEVDVEKKIYDTIKNQNNISFLISSSQNIDRIVSAYRACIRAGKSLIIDIYTAWVLEKLKLVSEHVPAMEWDLIEVYADRSQDEKLKEHPEFFGDFRKRVYKYRIKKEEIQNDPSHYLFFGRMSRFKMINWYKKLIPVNVIYSQWLGYLECINTEYYGAEEIAAYRNDPQVHFVYAHTSGHATREVLKTFADAINPVKLAPIHTEHRDKYAQYFSNVFIMEDNVQFMLTEEKELLKTAENILFKRMSEIREKVDRKEIAEHLSANKVLYEQVLSVFDELDIIGYIHWGEYDAYDTEAQTVLLRLVDWGSVDDLQKIIAEEFAWWELLEVQYDLPVWKVAARRIWNAWRELKGEPPEIFSDKVEWSPKREAIVIEIE